MSTRDAPTSRDAVLADASCPRCGHSQRGVLHPDAEAWPLTTACSECGLQIRWGEYVESQFDLPVLWVEHAPLRRWLLALPLTVLAGFVGWPLWGRMRLSHPPRLGRLVAAVVAIHAVLFVGLLFVHANRAMAIATRSPIGEQPVVIVLQDGVGQTAVCEATWREPSWWARFAALKPLFTQPTSQAPMPADGSLVVGRQMSEARQQRRWSGISVNLPDPFGSSPPESVPFNSAAAAAAGWGAPMLMPSPRAFWTRAAAAARFPFGFAMGLAIIATATFTVLPIARRRAKVRWVHVVRAGLYALLGPATLTIGLLWLFGIGSPQTTHDLANLLLFTIFLGPCLLLHAVWWRLAAGSYLRMTRPLAVAASVAVVGVLGATAIAVKLL